MKSRDGQPHDDLLESGAGEQRFGCMRAAEHRRFGQNPAVISIYSQRCNPSRPASSRERPGGWLAAGGSSLEGAKESSGEGRLAVEPGRRWSCNYSLQTR